MRLFTITIMLGPNFMYIHPIPAGCCTKALCPVLYNRFDLTAFCNNVDQGENLLLGGFILIAISHLSYLIVNILTVCCYHVAKKITDQRVKEIPTSRMPQSQQTGAVDLAGTDVTTDVGEMSQNTERLEVKDHRATEVGPVLRDQ